MRILLISTSFNTFTQRAFTDLIGAGHEVSVELPFSLDAMREAVDQFEPDLILCPFLKQIVPEDIWKTHLTIIMHPGIKGDRGPSSIDWAIMDNSREWGVTALEADAETDAGDIWSTNTFKLPLATKSYVYRTHITEAGMNGVFALIDKLDGLRRRVEEVDEPVAMRDIINPTSALKESIARAPAGCADLLPEPLNLDGQIIEGRLRPLMKQADRKIDWEDRRYRDHRSQDPCVRWLPGRSRSNLQSRLFVIRRAFRGYSWTR